MRESIWRQVSDAAESWIEIETDGRKLFYKVKFRAQPDWLIFFAGNFARRIPLIQCGLRIGLHRRPVDVQPIS
jgi:hypothetical protein